MNHNKNRFSPLMMALCVVIGILIGTFYANHFSGNRLNIINSGSNRLNNLLHIVDDQYVDSVNIDDLVEKAMPQILSELDPHSVYISAEDVQKSNDDLKGSFSGVGIEFVIRKDTLRVQNVIQGGPAEKAGIIAGDKIVTIDDKPFTGKIATNEEAMHRLKGKKNTTVKVGILRYKEKKVKEFTITRDDIITKSVTATYMLDDKTGYIRIKNFGDRTYEEMLWALAALQLENNNFSQLVIDAAKDAKDAKAIADGIKMINKNLVKMLEDKYGLTGYGKEGDEFNPDEHEAIGRMEDEKAKKETLAQVYLKGYKLKDKVIRHAKVMVKVPKA